MICHFIYLLIVLNIYVTIEIILTITNTSCVMETDIYTLKKHMLLQTMALLAEGTFWTCFRMIQPVGDFGLKLRVGQISVPGGRPVQGKPADGIICELRAFLCPGHGFCRSLGIITEVTVSR